MRIESINLVLRIALLVGALCYFAVILFLLKRKKLTVRYALLWLVSGCVLVVFAVFPYTVLVLRDLLKMEMPVNVVFTMVIAFLLLVSLSLSSIVSGLAEKVRRLAQEQALLEQRLRELEARCKGETPAKARPGAAGACNVAAPEEAGLAPASRHTNPAAAGGGQAAPGEQVCP